MAPIGLWPAKTIGDPRGWKRDRERRMRRWSREGEVLGLHATATNERIDWQNNEQSPAIAEKQANNARDQRRKDLLPLSTQTRSSINQETSKSQNPPIRHCRSAKLQKYQKSNEFANKYIEKTTKKRVRKHLFHRVLIQRVQQGSNLI